VSDMITVTEADFEADVRRVNLPGLVDFRALWCQPCGVLASELKGLPGGLGESS
jgi:thioredoxin-like negative regulator of GroEL